MKHRQNLAKSKDKLTLIPESSKNKYYIFENYQKRTKITMKNNNEAQISVKNEKKRLTINKNKNKNTEH